MMGFFLLLSLAIAAIVVDCLIDSGDDWQK